jgi:hypothetical protein
MATKDNLNKEQDQEPEKSKKALDGKSLEKKAMRLKEKKEKP